MTWKERHHAEECSRKKRAQEDGGTLRDLSAARPWTTASETMSSGSSARRDTFLAGAAAGAAVVLAASSFVGRRQNSRRRRRPSATTHVEDSPGPSHQVPSHSYPPSHHLPHNNTISQSEYYDGNNDAAATINGPENLSNRIGELPSRQKTKPIPWPWMEFGGYYVAASAKTLMDKLSSFVGPQGAGNGNDGTNSENNYEHMSSSMEGDDDSTSSEVNPSLSAKGLCIGSIFGLDVGGTLAKLVYFEQHTGHSSDDHPHDRREHYHQAAMARTVLEARRSTSISVVGADAKGHGQSKQQHSRQSEMDLERMWQLRQASVPDKLAEFGEEAGILSSLPKARANDTSSNGAAAGAASTRQDNHGGHVSLAKSFSTLTPMKKSRSLLDISAEKAEALDRFYEFAHRLDTYEAGVKDKDLSFYSRYLGGDLHFIRFETRRMKNAMDLIRVNNLHLNISEMGATGGGAHKYEDDWRDLLGVEMDKQDELDSLVAGMQFVMSDVVGECYTFQPARKHDRKGHQNQQASDGTGEQKNPPSSIITTESNSSLMTSSNHSSGTETDDSSYHIGNMRPDAAQSKAGGGDVKAKNEESNNNTKKKEPKMDQWWWSRKVQRDVIIDSETYPYLLVTIGTGVSILRVDGPRQHERISGSTIGGGTYWGLCRLLTNSESFEDVIDLAEKGDPFKVDMMVGDIYGKGSDALEKLGLSANLVASSFGKLVAKQNPAEGLEQEDLARALLLMITNNIGQVAYLNAQLHKTKRIYFVGNFLRHNVISQQRLAFAIDFWSGGKNEALFLEHEGYFGALGAFLLSQGIPHPTAKKARPRRSMHSHQIRSKTQASSSGIFADTNDNDVDSSPPSKLRARSYSR